MSALAMWSYHRRLSMDAAANQIKTPTETEPQLVGIEKKQPRKRAMRTESESSSSSVPPDERRVSIDPAEDDSEEDEATKATTQPNKDDDQEQHHKGHRRFSLDFLFSKKGRKNKKEKSKQKRSQSISTHQNDDDVHAVRELRYPGLAANDFSMFYFI